MDSRPGLVRAAAALAAAGLLGGLIVSPVSVSAKDGVIMQAADGRIKLPVINTGAVTRPLPGISAGTLTAALSNSASSSEIGDEETDAANPSDTAGLAVGEGTLGCHMRNPDGNVRVNQDCTFRRQAEEIIKINPTNSDNIIAGQNDSRVGYNKCGFDFSFDAGKHWGDGIPPFYMRENHPENDGPNKFDPNRNTILGGTGTGHTYDAGSDPAETFDSAGRAFFSCVLFDVHTNASGVLVTQSPLGAGGSFYDNVAAGSGPPSPSTKRFVVVEDNVNPNTTRTVSHDKEFIAADAFANSPNKDNVYVTWTVFFFDPVECAAGGGFCESPIYGSVSTDHAQTWSTPEEISGSSALCFFGNIFDKKGHEHSCDLDQGSDPQPMADGSLVVPFNNANTAAGNPNAQQLAVVCHPSGSSTDGTARLHCGKPSKVGDDIIVGEPQCNFGRGPEECVPGPFIRTNDFPRVGLDKADNSLFAVWQDFRNKEYDIQISRSLDGGNTWTEGGTINPTHGQDSYEPAIDVGSNSMVAASFFKSDQVPNENASPPHVFAPGDPGVQNEPSSYWLSGRQEPDTDTHVPFAAVRISPFFPPPDGNQTGFNGDYSGLAVHNSMAHPVWSDTRNTAVVTSPSQGVVHDEDIFTDMRAIPTVGKED